ncbi:MAG TPA: cation diffusion facilitator family transporter [Bacteroidota bacterium]|nr:cation diffusion facilitator family transporter [Bacteroidota bacterium]
MAQAIAAAEKSRVALSSVAAAVFITALKLVVGLETNSLGILSEAAHSGLDMLAAILTLVAVRIAARPPDKDHPYGHGKVENISAFIETMLLVATCIWIIKEAVGRLVTGSAEVEANIWGFGVIALSILIDIGRSRALRRAARTYRSQALEADALHFSSDVWSSVVVLAGLFFVSIGQPLVDAVAAIVVAVLVLVVSFRMGRRSIEALMDRVPEGLEEELGAVLRGVGGVSEVRGIRLRQSGSRLFLDATVGIARTMPFLEAHKVMDAIEASVRAGHPGMDVIVHGEPVERSDESMGDRIRMIIAGMGLPAPHHLEVHEREGAYHVEFDIEISQEKNFVEAHDISSAIEREIHERVPAVEHVTIHMEEFHGETNQVAAATGGEAGLLGGIARCIAEEPRVLRHTGLHVLKIGDRYNLSVTCVFDRARTLGEIHGVICDLEKMLYSRYRELRRVTVHAEPG